MPTYREMLLDPRWQRMRLQVLEAADWQCESCLETEQTLHVHHMRYIKGRTPWEYEPADLKVLCAECHESSHKERARLDAILAVCDSWVLEEIAALIAGYVFVSDLDGTARSRVEQYLPDLDQVRFHAGTLASMVADGRHFLLKDVAKAVRGFYPEQAFTDVQRKALAMAEVYQGAADES